MKFELSPILQKFSKEKNRISLCSWNYLFVILYIHITLIFFHIATKNLFFKNDNFIRLSSWDWGGIHGALVHKSNYGWYNVWISIASVSRLTKGYFYLLYIYFIIHIYISACLVSQLKMTRYWCWWIQIKDRRYWETQASKDTHSQGNDAICQEEWRMISAYSWCIFSISYHL